MKAARAVASAALEGGGSMFTFAPFAPSLMVALQSISEIEPGPASPFRRFRPAKRGESAAPTPTVEDGPLFALAVWTGGASC